MKRIVAFITAAVLILLCLSGCVKNGGEDVSESAVPESVVPDSESVSEENISVKPDGLYFQLESLPDIGKYTPNEKTEYFFPDGAHSVFEPRDDYGKLVPYYADMNVYSELYYEEYFSEYEDYERYYTYSPSYGLMTENGKIITGGLWYEYNYYAFDRTSGFFCMFGFIEGDTQSVDIIASDGSWAIHTDNLNRLYNLYNFGVPLFCLGEGGEYYKVFSLEGETVLDLTAYITAEEYEINEEGTEVYYNDPNIVYTDGELFIVETTDPDNSDNMREYTALDASGNELYVFSEENGYVSYLGGRLLSCRNTLGDEDFILDLKGNHIIPGSYNKTSYSKTDKSAFACREEDGRLILHWFNDDGELIAEKTIDKGSPGYDVMDNYPRVAENGTVFIDYDKDEYYGFFGEKPEFPVPDGEIARISTEYDKVWNAVEMEEANYNFYFIVFTSDGRSLVCSPEGKLLCETEKPNNFDASPDSDNYYNVNIGVRDGSIYVLTDESILHVYSIDGKEQLSRDISSETQGYEEVYIQYIDSSIIMIYMRDEERGKNLVYSIPKERFIPVESEFFEPFGDYSLFGGGTSAYVITKNGDMIYKKTFSGLA